MSAIVNCQSPNRYDTGVMTQQNGIVSMRRGSTCPSKNSGYDRQDVAETRICRSPDPARRTRQRARAAQRRGRLGERVVVALLALVSWQDVEGAEGPDGADRRWTILQRREVHVADLGW